MAGRATTINQASIIRAIKAVKKSGIPMVIEMAHDGSVSIVPPELANRGTPVNDIILDEHEDNSF